MAFDHEETAKVERRLAKERAKKAKAEPKKRGRPRKVDSAPQEPPALQRCHEKCHYDLHPGESLHRGVPDVIHDPDCPNQDSRYVRHDVEATE